MLKSFKDKLSKDISLESFVLWFVILNICFIPFLFLYVVSISQIKLIVKSFILNFKEIYNFKDFNYKILLKIDWWIDKIR